MKEYLVPPLCGRTYLYGSQADASVSSRIVTALTMHINPEVLANALAEGISRFPQFAVGLAVGNEEYVFCPVDAPVPVFEASASLPKTFGDTALAGYLFMVSYSHKTVYFDFHRSIADEFGMMSFVKAVLLRYLELSGPSGHRGSPGLMWERIAQRQEYEEMGAILEAGYPDGQISRKPGFGFRFDLLRLP